MNPLSVAHIGFGFGPLHVAHMGFVPVTLVNELGREVRIVFVASSAELVALSESAPVCFVSCSSLSSFSSPTAGPLVVVGAGCAVVTSAPECGLAIASSDSHIEQCSHASEAVAFSCD